MYSWNLGAHALTRVFAGVLLCGLAGAAQGGDVNHAASALAPAVSTAALPSLSMTMAPLSLVAAGRTREPIGWTEFCRRYHGECRVDAMPAADVIYDFESRSLITRINKRVNAQITARTDMENWGVVERWDFAENGFGDCEDYVLLKRRALIEAGLPRQALLVTVVTDLEGDGHAVLTVKTDRGDFILDNMTDDVKLWRETPYAFVKRQSQIDPNAWLSLTGQPEQPMLVSR
ncbi:MAG: transglutaminase family protein [Hyphomicrobiales bacterium]|nr:transglutaminase family protein [Hyphomicrobiales bacterium]